MESYKYFQAAMLTKQTNALLRTLGIMGHFSLSDKIRLRTRLVYGATIEFFKFEK